MTDPIKPDLKVVAIRSGAPLLTDIASQLRMLADAIERGDHQPRRAMAVLCGPGDRLTIFHWGGDATKHEVAGAFLDAANMTIHRSETT